ncbi:MAG: DNA polymerase III subunit gamma/tau [bacterium]|nr:DNA polymerase III subunit gamma/tau [bacterium]MDZ4285758.1 DNA polymerase III subunit gamma/tau [Candidatus Sungbacteria bacterium]
MSEQVLYRKHRPQAFDEVVGQEHVVDAIRNSLKMDRIAHAYLFSGPRGVGKTTMARLIAKALNCANKKSRPCNSCTSCNDFNESRAMDLIEIDAASNRGIDEIRELREGVRFVPTQGQYKTYIIDEVHMLTKEAFNALLKTLEEPPSHAVFVLATTEIEKVPATIISRTQHYEFRRPGVPQITKRLQMIAKKEGATLDGDAAHLIAIASEGGLRDAESILGQIMAVEDKEITVKEVEDILGLPKREAAKQLFAAIAKKDAPAALAIVVQLTDAGHDLTHASKLLMRYFRTAMLLKTDSNLKSFLAHDFLPDEMETIIATLPSFTAPQLTSAVTTIFQNMQQFKKSPIPQLPLELTVVEIISAQV